MIRRWSKLVNKNKGENALPHLQTSLDPLHAREFAIRGQIVLLDGKWRYRLPVDQSVLLGGKKDKNDKNQSSRPPSQNFRCGNIILCSQLLSHQQLKGKTAVLFLWIKGAYALNPPMQYPPSRTDLLPKQLPSSPHPAAKWDPHLIFAGQLHRNHANKRGNNKPKTCQCHCGTRG